MSVRVRQCGKGKWQVDIIYRLPDGKRARDRRRVRLSAKTAAQRWGEAREGHLVQYGPAATKEVPTLQEFAPRFIEGHARANRQKPSGIAAKEMLLRVYLVPFLGHKRLDAISNEDIQRLKGSLGTKAAKTVNNVLTVLSVLLKKSVEWDVIDRMRCTIRLLPVPKATGKFHDFDQLERLVSAAQTIDAETHLIVLLGAEAGRGAAR